MGKNRGLIADSWLAIIMSPKNAFGEPIIAQPRMYPSTTSLATCCTVCAIYTVTPRCVVGLHRQSLQAKLKVMHMRTSSWRLHN